MHSETISTGSTVKSKETVSQRVGKHSMKGLFRLFLSGGVCFRIKGVYSGTHKYPGALHQLARGDPSVITDCRGGDWHVLTGEYMDERGIIRWHAFKGDERPKTSPKNVGKNIPWNHYFLYFGTRVPNQRLGVKGMVCSEVLDEVSFFFLSVFFPPLLGEEKWWKCHSYISSTPRKWCKCLPSEPETLV